MKPTMNSEMRNYSPRKPYPKLVISTDNKVVLMAQGITTDEDGRERPEYLTGVCLYCVRNENWQSYAVGTQGSTWNAEEFTDFNGTIEVCNL